MKNAKLLLALLLVAFIVSPSFVSAELAGDYDPQGSSSCILLQNNLRYRSLDAQTNNEVSILQDYLQSNNYLSTNPSGFFGLLTTLAVKNFQSANSITPTGYVGPLTRAKINLLTCGTPTNPVVSTPAQTPDNNGCLPGAIFSSTTGARCTAAPLCPNGFICDTGSSLKMNTAFAYDGSVHVNTTYDEIKYNPSSVRLNSVCPTGVSAVNMGNPDGSDICNKVVTMDQIVGPGNNQTVYKFTNNTGNTQRINFQATMVGPYDRAFGNYASAYVDIPPNPAQPAINISWSGGRGDAQIGLIDNRFDVDGTILGWINLNGSTNGSMVWNGQTVGDLSGTVSWTVSSLSKGPFRILGVSSGPTGNHCFGPNGDCNYVLSNYFSITNGRYDIALPSFSSISNPQPSVSYVQAKAADSNVIYSGEKMIVYGANLDGDTRIYIQSAGGGTYQFETASASAGQITIAGFNSGYISDGYYDLYAVRSGVTSNKIQIRYTNH